MNTTTQHNTTTDDVQRLRRLERLRNANVRDKHTVFYAVQTLKLRDILDSQRTKTASTDGRRIYWSREYLDSLTDSEVRYVLLHETLHCAHLHFARLSIDTFGNYAGDWAIERILRDIVNATHGAVKAPDGILTCPVDREPYSEEQNERWLRGQKRSQDSQADDSQDGDSQDGDSQDGDSQDGDSQDGDSQDGDSQDGDSQDGDSQDGDSQDGDSQDGDSQDGDSQDGDSQADDVDGIGGFCRPDDDGDSQDSQAQAQALAELRQDWILTQISAVQIARMRGACPGSAQMLVDEILAAPVIDWRQALADFLRSEISQRADWSRIARRYSWQSETVFPARRQDEPGIIVIARDTSGSVVDPAIQAEFKAHAQACCAEIGATCILMDCDTSIARELTLAPCDPWPDDALGGGGTNFYPIFDRVAELIDAGERVSGVIYFTDLEGTFPDSWLEPVPTLWINYGRPDNQAPFGRTVPIR